MTAQQLRSAALDVRVLGALEVTDGDRRLEISGFRARGLIALLARSVGSPVGTAEIVRQVWGLDPGEAGNPVVRNAVQARVSSLRRVLGADVLCAVPGGYLLDLPRQAVDACRFEASLAEARRLRPAAGVDEVAEAYRRALAQWRGEVAYADVRHVPGLAEDGDRLGELRLQALQESVALQVDSGRYDYAVTELLPLTRQYPQVEEFWALRMLALYRQGRQADALAVYREATRVLDQRFGLAPGARLREVEALILRATVPPAAGMPLLGPSRISRPTTSFLGRDAELDATLQVLRRTRLLTLTGPGGVGKTRLALEAVQALVNQVAPMVSHGVAVVDLVPYGRGDDLAAAVLDGLGAVAQPGGAASLHRARKPLQLLRDVLRERRLLLVLDNCEHVAGDVAALCAALLATTPGTTILATSTQPLDVPGEVVHPVAPLVVPAEPDPYVLAGSPAVRLFLDRARARHPGLPVDAAGVQAVARICRRLDGIPLAIELAAVRTSGLGVAEVERLLEDRFRFLDRGSDPDPGPDRHRTLESVVEWSYHLLDREERLALPRLSVFRGSFTAQQVSDLWARLGDDGGVMPALLDLLVTKSIVQAEPSGDSPGRFRLPETVRLYLARELADMGETERVERAHVDVYVSVATSCGALLKGAGQTRALRTLMVEDGNIRSALQRALDRGLGDDAQSLIGALGYVAWMRGGREPSWELIVRAMDMQVRDPAIRIRALAWAAHLGSVFGRLPEAVRFGEHAAELGRAHPETFRADLALAQVARAHALHRLRRWGEGDRVLAEARRIADSSEDRWSMAGPSMARGLGLLARGRIADAEAEFRTAEAHYRACADSWAQQRAVLRLARAHEARGDYAGAAELLARSAELVADLELPEVSAPAKAALARVTLMTGDIDGGRRIVEDLVRSPAVLWLDAPAAQLAQCEAILAEVDGPRSEAVRRHLDAGVRLADAGLVPEAVESWARVVRLAERESPQRAAAMGAAQQVAVTSEDPRVLAMVRDMRGRLSTSDRAGVE